MKTENRHTCVSSRDRTVDLVKSIAIYSVLLIHVSAAGLGTDIGSAGWLCRLFWGSISRAAVPLFLMASGALLLDPDRELPLKKLYTKNFPRLLAALLFWAACYKVFHLLAGGQMSVGALVQAGKELVLFQHEGHLYYLHIMLLVYAFLPLTRLAVKYADGRELRYLLGLWFLLGILYPTLRPYWPFTLLKGIPAQWLMNMTYASIGYTLLGWYLKAHAKNSRRRWALPFSLGFVMVFCGCWAGSVAKGSLDSRFLEGMSVGVCLLAVGIYDLCLQTAIPERAAACLALLSRASFCVFLVHIFFLQIFARLGLRAAAAPFAAVPLLALLVLACGCGVWQLLSRIPGVKKWLI